MSIISGTPEIAHGILPYEPFCRLESNIAQNSFRKYANHRQAQKACSTPPCLWRFRDTDWTRWLQSSFLVNHKLGSEHVKSTVKDHNYYMVGEPEKGGH